MSGFYPDKPNTASDGKQFESLCCSLHWQFFREHIEMFEDEVSQCTIGENRQGIEFKELKHSFNSLHIEIEERTSVDGQWHDAGIMRGDNSKRYECGNDEDIFAFLRSDLRRWRQVHSPKEVWFGGRSGLTSSRHPLSTIRSFVLPKSVAWGLCLYRFQCTGGEWTIIIRNTDWMVQHYGKQLGLLADTPLGNAGFISWSMRTSA